ncbi:MAG: tetratricopeptide repeat protein [Bacteroidota bacterium]
MKQSRALFLLLILGLITVAPLQAQKKKKGGESTTSQNPKAEMFQHHWSIYEAALSVDDLAVATNSLYQCIALQPDRIGLKDTLARIYFQRSAWPQCILTSTQVLEKQPESEAMLELRAVSRASLNLAKDALSDYEKLYGLTSNPYHLYEIATLQFTMRRFGECEQSIARLLKDEALKDQKIVLGTQKSRQEVPLNAACLNMRGVVDLEQGRKESAAEFFNAALKLFPEFTLAKNNLELSKK